MELTHLFCFQGSGFGYTSNFQRCIRCYLLAKGTQQQDLELHSTGCYYGQGQTLHDYNQAAHYAKITDKGCNI